MKIRVKATKALNKATKPKSKVTLASEKKRIIVPRLRRIPMARLEAFDTLFDEFDVVEGTTLPSLSRCGIAIEGMNKSGKTTIMAGSQECIIAKCNDGRPIVARCRAKVINIPDLQTLYKFNKDVRDTAKRLGKDSPYCQVFYDPISTIVRWLAAKHVDKYNKKRCYDRDGELIPEMKGKEVEFAGELEGYGPWSDIATEIERMLISWSEIGWGWAAAIHYHWKAGGGFQGGMDWRASIPQTTAERIAGIADVRLSTEREEEKFVVRYYGTTTQILGSRIPLTGYCELPDYQDENTAPGVTSFDAINADFEDACREFMRDQSRFAKANEEILRKAERQRST